MIKLKPAATKAFVLLGIIATTGTASVGFRTHSRT